MDKRGLSERDICTQYITPASKDGGWNLQTQVREEVHLTKGRVMVRGKLVARGEQKRADCVRYFKPNLPIAVQEAKDANHSVGDGMQKTLLYAKMLDVSFALPSNLESRLRERDEKAIEFAERLVATVAPPRSGSIVA